MRVELGPLAAERLGAGAIEAIRAELAAFENVVSPDLPLDPVVRIDIRPHRDSAGDAVRAADSVVLIAVNETPYRYSVSQARQAASLAIGEPGMRTVGPDQLWTRLENGQVDRYVIELARSITTEQPDLLAPGGRWQEWLTGCPKSVTIAVETDYLRSLSEGAEASDEGILGYVRNFLMDTLGLIPPALVLQPDDLMASGTFAVWINGLRTTAFVGPDRNSGFAAQVEGQADDSLSILSSDIRLRGLFASRERLGQLAAGSVVLSPLGYLAISVAAQLKRHAHWLMDASVAEGMVDQLMDYAPLTGRAMHGLIGAETLAGELSELLAEGIPLHNFAAICEGMLEWRTRVPRPNESAHRTIRDRITSMIVKGSSTRGSMTVWLLSGGFRERFVTSPGQAIDALSDDLRAAVDPAESSGCLPVLLVDEDLRVALRRSLGVAVPEVHVVSFADIPSEQSICVIGEMPRRSLKIA